MKGNIAMTFYNLSEMRRTVITPEHSTAEGPTIKGRRIEVGYYRYPAGTGAKPHAHPEEQVITVLKGRIRSRVGREERILGPGEAVHIPANVEHENWAIEGEVEFISCKDVVR
jgi:quercetin dioxygenase-like cupin family protein